MTEAEWLACSDLRRMLDFVSPLATVHKMLAFASAFDRLLPASSDHEARRVGAQANAGIFPDPGPLAHESYNDYLMIAIPQEVLRRAYRGLSTQQQRDAMRDGCDLLREMFAPFRSAPLRPAWLVAND